MTAQRRAATVPVLIALAAGLAHAAPARQDSAQPDGTTLAERTGAAGVAGAADLGVGDTADVAVANRLRSVRVVKQVTHDDEEEFVRFCFRTAVQRLDKGKASSFAVVGPDPALGDTATDVTLDGADANCVIAGFRAGTDVRSHTLGAVEGGVVSNRDDEKSIADSAPLSGGRPVSIRSRTAGPELTAVRVSETLNRVQYHFDELLDEHGGGDAGAYGFYTARGAIRTGTRIVSLDDTVVTVEFGRNAQVDDARRAFVTAAAARDRSGAGNPAGSIGGRTRRPDLTRATMTAADTQYAYSFDENVSAGADASDFVLYTDTGQEIAGESVIVDGRRVLVTFPRATEDYDSGEIVLAAVDPDTGTPSGDRGEAATLGAAAIGSRTTRPGRTTGPDLISISADAGRRLLTLTFDERVDDEQQRTRRLRHLHRHGRPPARTAPAASSRSRAEQFASRAARTTWSRSPASRSNRP